MIVLGYRGPRNGPAIRFIRALGPRRLGARLSAGRLGRSQNLGPLKLRHGRRREPRRQARERLRHRDG